MKQSKVRSYETNYPKKLLKGAALTAATLVAVGGTACAPQIAGEIHLPDPTPEELVLDGEVGFELPPEDLMELGEPAVDENGEIILEEESHTREPDLVGKIVVPEDIPGK